MHFFFASRDFFSTLPRAGFWRESVVFGGRWVSRGRYRRGFCSRNGLDAVARGLARAYIYKYILTGKKKAGRGGGYFAHFL